MMEIRYCNKWSLFYKQGYNYMSEREAYKRHLEGRSYTAIISENDIEKYIVNVIEDWVSVYFLDANKRNYLYYSFKRLDEENIFLIESSYWQYDEENNTPLCTIHFTFSQDGNTIMSEKNEKTGEVIQKEGCFSIEKNMDKYPKFGEYADVCREER